MAYYVYLLASRKHGTLYLGVTNDIVRRVYDHRTKAGKGFTTRYDVNKLVWFEIYDDAITAIAREKELKKWRRDWKRIPGGLIFIRKSQAECLEGWIPGSTRCVAPDDGEGLPGNGGRESVKQQTTKTPALLPGFCVF
jgi:putative endonuclease